MIAAIDAPKSSGALYDVLTTGRETATEERGSRQSRECHRSPSACPTVSRFNHVSQTITASHSLARD
jgi:hypothetical protein